MDVIPQVIADLRQGLESPLFRYQSLTLSLWLVLQTLVILAAAYVLSRFARRLLRRNLFPRARIGEGVEHSISRTLHYVIMVLGVFVALDHAGLDLTALAAVGAVLMVGVGFGLQNVANNFISGLILLFERPVQVGDFIEAGGTLGTVRAIRARSAIVETLDHIAIIVPNSVLVSETVTNWSHRDKRTRIHARVGVAYGSDTVLVRDSLLEVARAHAEVLSDPAPQVQFLAFGSYTYDFDLLVWIDDPPRQNIVRSDLNFAIVDAFRAAGIHVPVPQRDLHVRSAATLRVIDGSAEDGVTLDH